MPSISNVARHIIDAKVEEEVDDHLEHAPLSSFEGYVVVDVHDRFRRTWKLEKKGRDVRKKENVRALTRNCGRGQSI